MRHVVIGAGQVGGQLAELLLAEGHQVVQVSRSGSGAPGAEKIAASAADADALLRACAGADVIYNCVNPPYHRWPLDWPPMHAAMLRAAQETGAVLVMLGNLYAYGPVSGPMTEDLPLAATHVKGRVRAEMWERALAAGIRTTEIRGSDFFGPGSTGEAYLTTQVIRPAAENRPVVVLSDPDVPHAWTYLPDVARALLIAGADERAWGRPWHVPTSKAMTFREVAERSAALAGARRPRIVRVPRMAFHAMGWGSPKMRELRETLYQFEAPFLLDSSDFEKTFGVAPTPIDEALVASILK
ncbi:NAD-dependent epimerase/dehydratase family protein [Herbidospora galbida]|uniref:NAD-dependent epimerase/dehydratase family protein n=1 Tax=Herbidospora galbida TaxID=2575442 RepID=A0A4U3MKI3_9ACTN|nr:NAD-dependent epimerase/dehydratase family protein [Herbidospora galbida]TKK89024.1 NAD-dependent epimerase/dehydratase family protein [Herbidospora galbida]